MTELKVNDIVNYSFETEFFENKQTVKATIIQIYDALYQKECTSEVSIRFQYKGDTVTIHGIPINSLDISKAS